MTTVTNETVTPATTIKVNQFTDVAKKPVAEEGSNQRAIYLLARAISRKDGSTKEKIHHAVMVPAFDIANYFVPTTSFNDIALAEKASKALRNVIESAQDELVKDEV